MNMANAELESRAYISGDAKSAALYDLLDSSMSQNETDEEAIDVLSMEVKDLTQDITYLNNEIATLDARIRVYEQDELALNREIESLCVTKESLVQENTELAIDLNDMAVGVKVLDAEIATLLKTIQGLETEIAQLIKSN